MGWVPASVQFGLCIACRVLLLCAWVAFGRFAGRFGHVHESLNHAGSHWLQPQCGWAVTTVAEAGVELAWAEGVPCVPAVEGLLGFTLADGFCGGLAGGSLNAGCSNGCSGGTGGALGGGCFNIARALPQAWFSGCCCNAVAGSCG